MATFLLDIGEGVEESGPSTRFEYTYSDKNNRVTVEMSSGDTLNGNLLRFGGAATEKTVFGGIPEWSSETVTAGATATVEVESEETLMVIWKGNQSDQTAILGKYEVPKDPSATASIGTVNTRGAPDGPVCVYNVQFSDTWGDSVYVYAEDLDDPSLHDGEMLTTSGGDVGLSLTHHVSNHHMIKVVVYETKNKNNQLDSVTSEALNHGYRCSNI